MNISSDIACWPVHLFFFFFFNDTATTEIYTLSLHDALPISCGAGRPRVHILVLYPHHGQADESAGFAGVGGCGDRKSTRLNSSHDQISYAVFCLKKKKYLLKSLSLLISRLGLLSQSIRSSMS